MLQELAVSVKEELDGSTSGTIEALEDIFHDLVAAIVKQEHGGLLLVTKQPDWCEFSSSREIECSLLQRLLLQYWNDVATLLAEVGGVDNLITRQQLTPSRHSQVVASDTTMLENCLRSISQLAGMDGAIVMDYACNVVAFNAIIARNPVGATQASLVDRNGREIPEAQVIKNRGSRHQSALSYVRRVPDSFVFAISQDGGVSAFHNRGDGTVLCEVGHRVLG